MNPEKEREHAYFQKRMAFIESSESAELHDADVYLEKNNYNLEAAQKAYKVDEFKEVISVADDETARLCLDAASYDLQNAIEVYIEYIIPFIDVTQTNVNTALAYQDRLDTLNIQAAVDAFLTSDRTKRGRETERVAGAEGLKDTSRSDRDLWVDGLTEQLQRLCTNDSALDGGKWMENAKLPRNGAEASWELKNRSEATGVKQKRYDGSEIPTDKAYLKELYGVPSPRPRTALPVLPAENRSTRDIRNAQLPLIEDSDEEQEIEA